MIILFILSALTYFHTERIIIGNIVITVSVLVFLFMFICLNYKIYIIAKSKQKDQSVAPSSAITSSHQKRKKTQDKFKKYLYMFFGGWLFFHLLFSTNNLFCFASIETLTHFRHVWLYFFWSATLIAMNSTFNCLIFFGKIQSCVVRE